MMLVMAVLRLTTNTASIPELMEEKLIQLTGGQTESYFINQLAPVITNFTWRQVNGISYQFTGQVTGSYVQGLTVVFGGSMYFVRMSSANPRVARASDAVAACTPTTSPASDASSMRW